MGWWQWLRKNSLLLLILLVGLILYGYRLGLVPAGVYSDEAVVGYNAYSILMTGRDEYGKLFPVYFKFFGTFTPGLFVYVQALVIRLLGLSVFSIRIISIVSMVVIAGLLAWFVYGTKLVKLSLVRELAALLLLISPWAFLQGRVGYETTFALMLLVLGIVLYRKPLWSFLFLSLSTYAGFTERYLAAMIGVLIIGIFYREKNKWKALLMPTGVALFVQIPNFILMFTPAFWVKDSSYTVNFFGQYLSYFSPANLFYRSDYQLQRSIPELAVFYGWMFVPWIVGLYCLWQRRRLPIYQFIIGLLLLSPLPAALGNVNYSTQRALPLLFPSMVIIIVGIEKIITVVKRFYLLPLGVIVLIYSLIMLYRSYFIILPAQRARAWDYGYESLALFIKQHPQTKFVIDNGRSVPYIELLFFLKYPPKRYQADNPPVHQYYSNLSFSGNSMIGNAVVRSIIWREDLCKNVVLVGDPLAISDGQVQEHHLAKVWDVRDPEGTVLLRAFQTTQWQRCQ